LTVQFPIDAKYSNSREKTFSLHRGFSGIAFAQKEAVAQAMGLLANTRRRSMLVLSRKSGEGIVIDGGITITVLEAGHRKVRIGVYAPDKALVLREELAEYKSLRRRPQCFVAREKAAVRR
jgi:carbon storage regulator